MQETNTVVEYTELLIALADELSPAELRVSLSKLCNLLVSMEQIGPCLNEIRDFRKKVVIAEMAA